MRLSANKLDGQIPPELDQSLQVGKVVGCNANELTGPIPVTLGQPLSQSEGATPLRQPAERGDTSLELDRLSELRNDLRNSSANKLDGQIPPELGNLTKLEKLRLNANELTGEHTDTAGPPLQSEWKLRLSDQPAERPRYTLELDDDSPVLDIRGIRL